MKPHCLNPHYSRTPCTLSFTTNMDLHLNSRVDHLPIDSEHSEHGFDTDISMHNLISLTFIWIIFSRRTVKSNQLTTTHIPKLCYNSTKWLQRTKEEEEAVSQKNATKNYFVSSTWFSWWEKDQFISLYCFVDDVL